MSTIEVKKLSYYARNKAKILAKAKIKYQLNSQKIKDKNIEFYYRNWDDIQKRRYDKRDEYNKKRQEQRVIIGKKDCPNCGNPISAENIKKHMRTKKCIKKTLLLASKRTN